MMGGGVALTKTGANGTFEVGIVLDPGKGWSVAVSADEGFAQASEEELRRGNQRLVLEPWGRIEGYARAGGQPAVGYDVMCTRFGFEHIKAAWGINFDQSTKVSSEGRYVFNRVVSGPVWVDLLYPNVSQNREVIVNVAPGETRTLDLGSQGRTLTGRVTGIVPGGGRLRGMLTELVSGQPEYTAADKGPQPYQFLIEGDGAFRVRDIPPGDYRLDVYQDSPKALGIAASAKKRITVPQAGAGDDSPFAIGELALQPKKSGQ
jgi:hypothetical protein